MKAFYDPRMNIEGTGDPIFVRARLLKEAADQSGVRIEWCPFPPTSWEDWSGIHSADYIANIIRSPDEALSSASIPITANSVAAQHWGGGSLLAACAACLIDGVAMSPSGHFHHAHYAQAGAMCLLNALVLCAVRLTVKLGLKRVLILDCDFHRGDGTADILETLGRGSICHVSLGKLYSRKSQAAQYMNTISAVAREVAAGDYDAVIYQAGMDVLLGDPAGGGILSYRQAYARDELVFSACLDSHTPIAWDIAGGYRLSAVGGLSPTLRGHMNTVVAACKVFERLDARVVESLLMV